MIAGFFVGMIALGFVMWNQEVTEDADINSQQLEQTKVMNYKHFAYAIWGTTAIIFLVLLCMYSRIELAIA